MSNNSKEIITQWADFRNESLKDQDGNPIYPFPDPAENSNFKASSADYGDIGVPYREHIATWLGRQPGSDTGKVRWEDGTSHSTQPWKYVLGDNVIDLRIDGADGSPKSNAKTLYQVAGYKYLLSATSPGGRPRGGTNSQRKYTNEPDGTGSLFVSSSATFNSVSHGVGFYIGSPYGCHEVTKARWCCPVGIQFNWDDKESTSKPNTSNEMHRYKALYLMYQEKDYYKLQFAPLIWNYKEQDNQGLNYHSGDTIHTYRQHPEHEGFSRYFLSKESIEYLTTHRCALVGLGARMTYEDSAGTERYHAERFWNVKFLFDTVEHPNSKYIWQEPISMFDYMEAESVRLA